MTAMPSSTIQTALLALLGFLLFFAILHRLGLGLYRTVLRLAPRFVGPAAVSRAYVMDHPLMARFESRYPRFHGFLAGRLRPRPFTALPLTLLIAAGLYTAALFAGLIDELHEAEGIVIFDTVIDDALAALRVQPAIDVFVFITELGQGATVTAVALVATAFLWIEQRARYIPALWITLVGSQLTTYIGKYAIGRVRPEFLDIATASAPSFPSGHTTAAMAIYGFLAYVAARRLNGQRAWFEITYWACVLIFLVGFSRVFLRVHFASDVVAGFLVGGFWLLAGVAVSEWQAARTKNPATER